MNRPASPEAHPAAVAPKCATAPIPVRAAGGSLGWVVMRLTVLGGCGAWPEAGQACSGFLVEHDGFRLVVDLGYATVPRLLERAAPAQVDAVFISHGHPDHCADLNPLLRARVLREDPAGRRAAQAGAGHLLLTHLLPGTDPAAAQDAAAGHYTGHVDVAASGLVVDLP